MCVWKDLKKRIDSQDVDMSPVMDLFLTLFPLHRHSSLLLEYSTHCSNKPVVSCEQLVKTVGSKSQISYIDIRNTNLDPDADGLRRLCDWVAYDRPTDEHRFQHYWDQGLNPGDFDRSEPDLFHWKEVKVDGEVVWRRKSSSSNHSSHRSS